MHFPQISGNGRPRLFAIWCRGWIRISTTYRPGFCKLHFIQNDMFITVKKYQLSILVCLMDHMFSNEDVHACISNLNVSCIVKLLCSVMSTLRDAIKCYLRNNGCSAWFLCELLDSQGEPDDVALAFNLMNGSCDGNWNSCFEITSTHTWWMKTGLVNSLFPWRWMFD